ncbi:H(+)-transporting V1 sector ATPase subunit G [Rhizophlyctis rosea]|uniref:V-type proton ATPase subunit G n=1 Tax=Rhizophlyctis rosea TaxID=64517 RepID=A0AAD5X2V4_9FUNG|nr:H(+)-transporting V1 sector ATPase subunit G [Rhizophlyctis rosea]
MAASNQGIQTLLEAEKESSKIVTKARQYRIQRLKDARTEAAKEVEALKGEKNKEFAGFEKQFSGNSDDTFAKVNEETEERLVEVRQAYEKNKDLVIERLLAGITNVAPKPHPNAPKVKPAA